jgi:outer membrane protein OmpA-like peptidoglycan-associated protein
MFRDTERQCWVTEHHGKTYYIGGYILGTPPQLMHRVLVQGMAHEGMESCGGVVISPVSLSVLPELDAKCDTVLPDNGVPPSEPSFFDLPPPLLLSIGLELPYPSGPFKNLTQIVHFDFDSSWLNQTSQQSIEAAAKYAMASKAESVIVTGRAQNSLLDDGKLLAEASDVAQRRAHVVQTALVKIGVDSSKITTLWKDPPAEGNGATDAEGREVTIEIHLKKD